jgi:heat shock protein HtpX
VNEWVSCAQRTLATTWAQGPQTAGSSPGAGSEAPCRVSVQLAISRSREYGADATGAALCGDPDALASALERLEDSKRVFPYELAGRATAHMFIVNPLRAGGLAKVMELLSTRPPIEERVRRLRAMRA